MLEKLKPCPFCGGDVKIINAEKLTINHHRSGGERGMTCKDCIYYSGCSGILNDFGMRLNPAREVCDRFKDRFRFVELPCKVGDMVYMIAEQMQKVGRKKVTKTVIVECCVDNFRIGDAGYPSAALCDNENAWYYGVEPKMFGEIIFLSREEAEQALKEREK